MKYRVIRIKSNIDFRNGNKPLSATEIFDTLQDGRFKEYLENCYNGNSHKYSKMHEFINGLCIWDDYNENFLDDVWGYFHDLLTTYEIDYDYLESMMDDYGV